MGEDLGEVIFLQIAHHSVAVLRYYILLSICSIIASFEKLGFVNQNLQQINLRKSAFENPCHQRSICLLENILYKLPSITIVIIIPVVLFKTSLYPLQIP